MKRASTSINLAETAVSVVLSGRVPRLLAALIVLATTMGWAAQGPTYPASGVAISEPLPRPYYVPAWAPASAPASFADTAFQQVWERTDAPVLAGRVQRSWYWGPQPGESLYEPYSGGKTGKRLVQYFDKARMEINNPAGDRSSQWFVTTGLLVVEMVSGRRQVGDRQWVAQRPAEIAVGGDGLSADPDAPTYTSFRAVASLNGPDHNRAPRRIGQSVTATINRAGKVGDDPALGLYSGTRIAAYCDVTGHNIPQAMWDFLNMKGVVQQGGALVDGQTVADWVYVMGYPITEPYWARVKVEGVYYDVLFQLYERRSLAYIPSFPKGWQVQMGNVGRHYYRWLYGGPLPTPVAGVSTLAPSPSPVLPTMPEPVDAVVSPQAVQAGTPVSVSIRGFRPGEAIVSWFTAPDGAATDARINLTADERGAVDDVRVPTADKAAGIWAITFHGRASNHEAIAYFYIYLPATPSPPPTGTARQGERTRTPVVTPTPTPTWPVVPTETPSGLVLSVNPGDGPPDAEFTFLASGLAPGEQVQVIFTDPNGDTQYPANSDNGRYRADDGGRLSFSLIPVQAFPSVPTGTWLFEVRGQQSGLEGVIGFVLR